MKKGRNLFVALLRGINVGGHKQIPMAELRSLCAKLLWRDVQTYIQSGNLVFTAGATPAVLETQLETAIERRFGFAVPVIVRPAADWPAYVKANPFPEVTSSEPKRVMLLLTKAPPKSDAAKALQERADDGERVRQVGDALWIHFPGDLPSSKLSPAVLDRLIGSSATARNWRTVLKLDELTTSAILSST